jgi:hypothetical protein
MARCRAQAMRTHEFVGDEEYCQARIGFAPMGSPETGTVTGWMGCGYPRDLHPEAPTYPGKPCDWAEEHEPHLWQETGIPTGNPLVEYTQWWQCGEPASL